MLVDYMHSRFYLRKRLNKSKTGPLPEVKVIKRLRSVHSQRPRQITKRSKHSTFSNEKGGINANFNAKKKGFHCISKYDHKNRKRS